MRIGIGVVGLIIALICAYLGHRIAVSKGRGPVLWAIICFIFPLIGLIIILLLPPKTAAASYSRAVSVRRTDSRQQLVDRGVVVA